MVSRGRLDPHTDKECCDFDHVHIAVVEYTDQSPLTLHCRVFGPQLCQINWQSNHWELQLIEILCRELFFIHYKQFCD